MSDQRDGYNFRLLSLKSFADEELARRTLDLLTPRSSFVKLSRYGSYDPLEGSVQHSGIDELLRAWFSPVKTTTPFCTTNERILRFAGENGNGGVMLNWGNNTTKLNLLSGHFPNSLFTGESSVEEFIQWVAKLCAVIDPVIGFIQNTMTKG